MNKNVKYNQTTLKTEMDWDIPFGLNGVNFAYLGLWLLMIVLTFPSPNIFNKLHFSDRISKIIQRFFLLFFFLPSDNRSQKYKSGPFWKYVNSFIDVHLRSTRTV